MADIELIPDDYTQARALRRRLIRAGLVIVLLALAAAAARGWLAWRMSAERPLVQRLAAREATVQQQGQRLVALRAEKTVAVARLAALRTLQDGAAWLTLVAAVDRSWTPKVWLAGMTQQRELHFAPRSHSHDGHCPGRARQLNARRNPRNVSGQHRSPGRLARQQGIVLVHRPDDRRNADDRERTKRRGRPRNRRQTDG